MLDMARGEIGLSCKELQLADVEGGHEFFEEETAEPACGRRGSKGRMRALLGPFLEVLRSVVRHADAVAVVVVAPARAWPA